MSADQVKAHIRKCFHEADLFKVNANLRTKGEAETSRMCSGIFSLLLIGFFTYIFVRQLIKLFSYQSISSSQIFQTDTNFSNPAATNLKMSISPAWLSYAEWKNSFDVEVYLVKEANADANGNKAPGVQTKLEMELCTAEQWAQHKEIYDAFAFKDNYCVKDPGQAAISGSNLLAAITYLKVLIKRCNTTTNPSCANSTQFATNMVNLYKNMTNFGTFYFSDVSINANNLNSIEEFISLNHFLEYSLATRKRLVFYLGTYTVQTQRSFIPLVEDNLIEKGYFISKTVIENIDIEIQKSFLGQQIYGDVYIYMTSLNRKYVRKVGKIDDVISYAGGLFGILISLFAYCVFYYNKYSYELVVAQTAFNNDGQGEKIREKEFHFLKYIKYQIFSWIKLVFCCELKWKDCRKIEECRNEANKYMDVSSLFRRVQLFELLLSYIVDPNKYMLIELTEPYSIEKVKEKRLMIEYYEIVIGEDVAIKLDDIRDKNQSLKLYEELQAEKKGNNNNVVAESESKEQRGEKIRQNLMENLELRDEHFLVAISGFPEIEDRAAQVVLKPEMEEVEKLFAKAYLDLPVEKKVNNLAEIPFKIIHRLSMAAKKIKEQPVSS